MCKTIPAPDTLSTNLSPFASYLLSRFSHIFLLAAPWMYQTHSWLRAFIEVIPSTSNAFSSSISWANFLTFFKSFLKCHFLSMIYISFPPFIYHLCQPYPHPTSTHFQFFLSFSTHFIFATHHLQTYYIVHLSCLLFTVSLPSPKCPFPN